MRRRLAVPFALSLLLLLATAGASAAAPPLAVPDANDALLFALGLIGLGAGLSRPPQD